MGPHGSPNFKQLFLLEISFELFQTSEFTSQWSVQKVQFALLKFWHCHFKVFLSFRKFQIHQCTLEQKLKPSII